MKNKFLKTVAVIASASLVMLSAVTCFAAETTTQATFDFTNFTVEVTTTAVVDDDMEMVTYLVTEGSDTLAKDSSDKATNVMYIDQKAPSNGSVEFNFVTDLAKLYGATSYIKLGSTGANPFETENLSNSLNSLSGALTSGSGVRIVKGPFADDDGNWTIIGRLNDTSVDGEYGAVLVKDNGDRYYIPVLNAEGNKDATVDAVTANSDKQGYFAVTVTGLDLGADDCEYELGLYKQVGTTTYTSPANLFNW